MANDKPKLRPAMRGGRTRANDPADASSSGCSDLELALREARARGRLKAAEILDGEEMLDAGAFAKLLRVTRGAVHIMRRKNELLALNTSNSGFRFPAWQIDANGRPYSALPMLFERLGGPWTVYRFLMQRHADLGSITGLEALRNGHSQTAIQSAEGIAEGNFA
nr:hypothetical protein DBT41_11155 [Aerococcus urinae]